MCDQCHAIVFFEIVNLLLGYTLKELVLEFKQFDHRVKKYLICLHLGTEKTIENVCILRAI